MKVSKQRVLSLDDFFLSKVKHNHIGLYLYLILESREKNIDQYLTPESHQFDGESLMTTLNLIEVSSTKSLPGFSFLHHFLSLFFSFSLWNLQRQGDGQVHVHQHSFKNEALPLWQTLWTLHTSALLRLLLNLLSPSLFSPYPLSCL